MPEFTPAVETLLRTIHAQGEQGATFTWETGGYYRLTGTDYRVARRSFFPLTGGGYVVENDDDNAPVKLTDKGREWIARHPVPRGGSRGPYLPARATRPRSVRQSPADQRLTAYGVMKDQFEENGMRPSLSPIYARAVEALRDLENADRLEAAGFPEAAAFLRKGRQALVDEAFGHDQ